MNLRRTTPNPQFPILNSFYANSPYKKAAFTDHGQHNFLKPISMLSFQPSQAWRLLKKFIMKMMMASKGIIYSFYTV